MRTAFPAMLAAASVAAAGCASLHDPGWHGSGAEPFDAAQAACETAVAPTPAGAERTAAFDACMAEKGWHRP